jgi:hypothetical protein
MVLLKSKCPGCKERNKGFTLLQCSNEDCETDDDEPYIGCCRIGWALADHRSCWNPAKGCPNCGSREYEEVGSIRE